MGRAVTAVVASAGFPSPVRFGPQRRGRHRRSPVAASDCGAQVVGLRREEYTKNSHFGPPSVSPKARRNGHCVKRRMSWRELVILRTAIIRLHVVIIRMTGSRRHCYNTTILRSRRHGASPGPGRSSRRRVRRLDSRKP